MVDLLRAGRGIAVEELIDPLAVAEGGGLPEGNDGRAPGHEQPGDGPAAVPDRVGQRGPDRAIGQDDP